MGYSLSEDAGKGVQAVQTRWWQALNPAIYLVSVFPFFGIYLVNSGDFWITGIAAATFAVVLLQHAINLFNDVSDWKLGADTHKYDSWVRVFDGNTSPVFWQGVFSAGAGVALGILVLFLSDQFWILGIAAPLVVLGYLYNAGSRPLSYTVLGEWVTGLCYGGVFACLFLLGGSELTLPGILGSVTFACLAMALLLSHQPPQIETDRASGKHTFAVRYGKDVTHKTVYALLLMAVLSFSSALWQAECSSCAAVFLSLSLLAAVSLSRVEINPKSVILSATVVFLLNVVSHSMLYS